TEAAGEGAEGDAMLDGGLEDAPPRRRRGGESFLEEGIEHQAGQGGVSQVRVLDAVEKLGPDDAAPSPDRGQGAKIELPRILQGARREVLEALGVGDDLGRV